MWACCDGGVFVTTSPSGAATFEARNVGLQTMSANYISQHPTQPAVLFSGFQDNGTGRYLGEECWTHVGPGDGGYPVVNWNDPYKVLVYWNGSVRRATDGGRDYASWTNVTPAGASWFVMAQPLVTTPRNTGSPADAEVVAYGAGTSLFVSTNFGTGWTTLTSVGVGQIYSMVFASASRLYVGTTGGAVYRYDFNSVTSSWSQTRIDNVAAGALPLTGLVSDIAVDPADTTGASIYITFGGTGDFRHVWRFNGTSWQARSGPAGTSSALLDVEHNAIVCDGTNAVYAAADIGVWQSTNGGNTWIVLEPGLPDAAVLDLQIHQGGRLLRAALHGRGVYEYKLDSPSPLDTELYVRDTTLDARHAFRPSTGSTIRRRSPPPPSGTTSRRTSRSTCPRRPATRRRRPDRLLPVQRQDHGRQRRRRHDGRDCAAPLPIASMSRSTTEASRRRRACR